MVKVNMFLCMSRPLLPTFTDYSGINTEKNIGRFLVTLMMVFPDLLYYVLDLHIPVCDS